jgi:hypothetical protein
MQSKFWLYEQKKLFGKRRPTWDKIIKMGLEKMRRVREFELDASGSG